MVLAFGRVAAHAERAGSRDPDRPVGGGRLIMLSPAGAHSARRRREPDSLSLEDRRSAGCAVMRARWRSAWRRRGFARCRGRHPFVTAACKIEASSRDRIFELTVKLGERPPSSARASRTAAHPRRRLRSALRPTMRQLPVTAPRSIRTDRAKRHRRPGAGPQGFGRMARKRQGQASELNQ